VPYFVTVEMYENPYILIYDALPQVTPASYNADESFFFRLPLNLFPLVWVLAVELTITERIKNAYFEIS
jgi:hypothetical protein